ncbi:hypothetical protein [Rhodopirellula bahusiensis]|uniref:hypothetical protein n=1 Tax=Rhodopirellula bahusiensis TaxID=2014065 RepID=UPI0032650DCB
MNEISPYDVPDDRILDGPGDIRIVVPYKPPRTRSNLKADQPPFDPPLIWVSDYEGDYRTALRLRKIERDDRDYTFSERAMDWLESQREIVEDMLKQSRP